LVVAPSTLLTFGTAAPNAESRLLRRDSIWRARYRKGSLAEIRDAAFNAIATAQIPDNGWKYLQNAATRHICWDAKEGFFAVSRSHRAVLK
jgi:hypothetical protein